MAKKREKTITVDHFRRRSQAIIEEVAGRRLDRVVLTRRGKPIAAVVPVDGLLPDLWGAMRGTVQVMPGVDLTEPTGEVWDADQRA